MRYKFLALASLMLAVVGAAAAQKARRDVPPMPSNSVPVTVTVKTDKTVYKPEDPLTITATAKNTQKDKVTLPFSSGQRYDIEIREGKDGKGKQVWLWSKGRMFTESLTKTSLAPNAVMKIAEKAAAPKDKGVYVVRLTITTMDRTPRPFGMTTFTVK